MQTDSDWWDVIKGYKGFHKEVNDVSLGAFTTILGIMQTGKSTTINSIVRQINKDFDVKQINLITKHFGDIFKLHENEKLANQIRECEMINIFCDDAITSMHSKSPNKEKEIKWYLVRHYFREEVGLEAATINAFFAAQRYKTLSLVLRQAPILIFKPTIIRDDYEEMYIRQVIGQKALRNIKRWAVEIYYDGKVSAMKNCYLKIGDSPARKFVIPKTKSVDWIEIPHEEDGKLNGKLSSHQRAVVASRFPGLKPITNMNGCANLLGVNKSTIYEDFKALEKIEPSVG